MFEVYLLKISIEKCEPQWTFLQYTTSPQYTIRRIISALHVYTLAGLKTSYSCSTTEPILQQCYTQWNIIYFTVNILGNEKMELYA